MCSEHRKHGKEFIIGETGLRQKDDRKYTYGDYLSWPEDNRYELIDGVVYVMTPSPITSLPGSIREDLQTDC
jgi:hypothetical protein